MTAMNKSDIGSFSFPPEKRLKKRTEFLKIQNKAQRLNSKNFMLLIEPTQLKFPRLGVVVSKNVDKRATVRNRLKRLMREAFRKILPNICQAFDIVIIARQNAVQCSQKDVSEQFVAVLQKKGVL